MEEEYCRTMGGHPSRGSYPPACYPEVGTLAGDSPHGERFTECLDLLLKDLVKTHQGILRDMLRAPVAAVPVADPTPARNDRKLSPSVCNNDVQHMLIQRLEVMPVRGLSVSR